MANEKNLKYKARPCKLIHPVFGEQQFRSLTHAAGWLGSNYLQGDCGVDIYVSYTVLAFLLDNTTTLQFDDPNHPLNGLRVVENSYGSKQIDKHGNTEIQNYRNTEIQKYRNTEIQKYRSTEVFRQLESGSSTGREGSSTGREPNITIDEFNKVFFNNNI